MNFILLLIALAAWLVAQVLPGTEVIDRETPPPRSAPTDTGVGFMAGLTDRGAPVPTLIRSLGEFLSKFGDRQSYSVLYDTVETFFREGGANLYISRALGPAALKATHDLLDGAAAVSLHVSAASEGAWANGATGGLTIAVLTNVDDASIPVGSFQLEVAEGGVTVEKSPNLLDQAAALAWAASSEFISLTLGASANDPARVAAANLAGGTDDRANVTDTERALAVNKFTRDLGPGQVSYPGATTASIQTALLAHGLANNRVPILDGVDTADKSVLKAQAAALRGLDGDRASGLFAPWDIAPGILAGTTRTVPPSGRIMGNMARNDGLGLSPNVPAAGDKGQAQFITGLSQVAWTDDDRGDLNDAGVNLSRIIYGGVRTYGYRTLADPDTDSRYKFLNNARLKAAIGARGNVIAESEEFAELDGHRVAVGKFKGKLIGMLMDFYVEGSLYGDTPQEAFNVDTGDQVNTDASLGAGELHAVIAVRMSPFAERTIIEISRAATTEAVA